MSYNRVSQVVTNCTTIDTNLLGDVPESSVHHSINNVDQFLRSRTVDIWRIRVDTPRIPIPRKVGQLLIRSLDRWTLGLGREKGDQTLLDLVEVLPGLPDFYI